jgi:CBS-domain-containing membrane protein
MRIAEIMSRPAVTCRPNESLQEAARLMWECDCGAVPVVQNDGAVTGIVTDRDIAMAAYTKGERLRDIQVGAAMSKVVFTVRPETSLEEAERLMSEKQIRRLPVVDERKRPIGIIALGDVARAAAGQASGVRSGRDDHADRGERDAARTLAEISKPRRQEGRPSPSTGHF